MEEATWEGKEQMMAKYPYWFLSLSDHAYGMRFSYSNCFSNFIHSFMVFFCLVFI